ncbi:MAG: hypothetical protein KC733_03970 [Candidatus Omnitrophica bacterium]|nr:hypothetical protein [Candidatus Omnitrophota bacterium]
MKRSIICLANSRKYYERCIAGKTPDTYEWIRPVSSRANEELLLSQIKYADGQEAGLLDVIEIDLKEEKPAQYQPENWLIDEQAKWKKIGNFNPSQLDTICDAPKTIWLVGNYNDRVPEEHWKGHNIKSSLYLIKPSSFYLRREDFDPSSGPTKKKIRGVFDYNGVQYDFRVTDVKIEAEYLKKAEGRYTLNCGDVYLCISLSEPFEKMDNACFKLIASVIGV